jgi:VWFA-related protein
VIPLLSRALICAVAIAATTAAGHALAPQVTKPTFRATTAVVLVDVAVRSGAEPVAGLTAADFRLLDNGVEQAIEAVSVGAVPVDVTLLVDASPSVIDDVGRFRDETRRLPGLLRKEDRLRVIAFDRRVIEVGPMAAPSTSVDARRIALGEGTSIFDALLYAFLWEPVPGRRHIVIALTDAVDTTSALDGEDLLRLAARTDATLYLALVRPSGAARAVGVGRPPAPVLEASALMGGLARPHGSSRDFLREFKAIFDEFKNRYVIRYEPRGVPREGWHDIAVSVTRAAGYAVTARKGYFGG